MKSTNLIGQRSPLHSQVNFIRDIDSGGARVRKMVGEGGGGALFQNYSSSEANTLCWYFINSYCCLTSKLDSQVLSRCVQ